MSPKKGSRSIRRGASLFLASIEGCDMHAVVQICNQFRVRMIVGKFTFPPKALEVPKQFLRD